MKQKGFIDQEIAMPWKIGGAMKGGIQVSQWSLSLRIFQ